MNIIAFFHALPLSMWSISHYERIILIEILEIRTRIESISHSQQFFFSKTLQTTIIYIDCHLYSYLCNWTNFHTYTYSAPLNSSQLLSASMKWL